MKFTPCLAALALIGAASGALAQSDAQPLQLRAVMLQMQADTEAAATGIEHKDWPGVARHAEQLARHAEPPLLEKVRILGWLFTDALAFRHYDTQVKAAASDLQAAAQQQDAAAAASAYARMQQSCDGCHTRFRTPFLERFYGAR